MIKETVLKWISSLNRRIEQYLLFEDLTEEHEEKMASLSGREKIDYELKTLGDFFASDYYNADFDPWPDEETRIDSLEDLLALAENDLEQKKLENYVEIAFAGSLPPDPEAKKPDSEQDAFFQMMTQAFGVKSEYDYFEQSRTELSEYLGGDFQEPGEDSESERLKARLAEVMDDHMDSF